MSRALAGGILLGCFWLNSGCGRKEETQYATVTLKKDGSQFSGQVASRQANSITITGAGGDTHTFLLSELSGEIKYGVPGEASGSGARTGTGGLAVTPAPDSHPGSGTGSIRDLPVRDTFRLPAGTTVAIANNGIIDSDYFDNGFINLGVVDTDVKAADGKVLIPQGANVTMLVRERKQVSGRVQMELEIASADFDNRHYVVSAEKSNDPGAIVTYTGALPGTPEVKQHGLNVHLEDHSLMMFKTETTTIFKVSQ